MGENPYRVPEAVLAEPARADALPSLGQFGSENGSLLTLGPRRSFTGQWILGNRFPSLLTSVMWSVPIIVLGTPALLVSTSNLLFVLFGWPIVVTLAVILMAPVRWSGFPPLDRPQHPHAPTELTFDPRLPGTRDELRDKADDVGFVWTEADFLVYQGDRATFRIHRSDMTSLAPVWTLNGVFGAWSPELAIELAIPLAGRRTLRLVRRDRSRTPAAPFRNARLRREIRAWFAGGE